MESLFSSIVKRTRKADLELLLMRWGRLCLTEINWRSTKPNCAKKLVALSNDVEISFHDVAELDLLLCVTHPEKLRWQAFALDGGNATFEDSKDLLCSLSKNLVHFDYYDITFNKTGHHIWVRVSKPEHVIAAYLCLTFKDSSFSIAGPKHIARHVYFAAASSLEASKPSTKQVNKKDFPFDIVNALSSSLKQQNFSHGGAHRPLRSRYNTSSSDPINTKQRSMELVGGQATQALVFTFEARTRLMAKSAPTEEVVICGRLRFIGDNLPQGLRELVKRKLAMTPLPVFFTSKMKRKRI